MPLTVSCLCGMLTATCGGLVRDVLCGRKNQGILYSGEGEAGALYAPTALVGAAAYGGLCHAGAAQPVAILLGVGTTIALRCAAYSYRVALPPMTSTIVGFVAPQQESAPQPSLAQGDAHMFVSAYGPDRLGSVAAMTACIAAVRGNISASKIITIGEDIAFMMVVSAPSEVADSLGKALRASGQTHGLRVETSQIEVSGGGGGDSASAPPGAGAPAGAEASWRLPAAARSHSHETGVSRGVDDRAEGDLFCLSAVVTSYAPIDFERLQAEASLLEARHGVRLQIRPLGLHDRPSD